MVPEDDADSLVMTTVAWAVFVARRSFQAPEFGIRLMVLLVSPIVSEDCGRFEGFFIGRS
jgi:hypothetical protein